MSTGGTVTHAQKVQAFKDLSKLNEEERERHTFFLNCVGALVSREFNGNRFGPLGVYAGRDQQQRGDGGYYDPVERPYLGHNIAAIAVYDRKIIGHAFNRINSRHKLAHAEAHLLDKLLDVHGGAVYLDENRLLSKVDVYSSLEPCRMCAGKLLMAGVRVVGFIQNDADHDGALLHAAAEHHARPNSDARVAGCVVQGADLGFENFSTAWATYRDQVGGNPFWADPVSGAQRRKATLPYFLCSDAARDLFQNCDNTVKGTSSALQPYVADAKTYLNECSPVEAGHAVVEQPPAAGIAALRE